MVCGLLSCVPVIPVEDASKDGRRVPNLNLRISISSFSIFSTVPHQGLAGLERMFDILRSRHRNSHASGIELTSDGHLATRGSLRCSHLTNFSKVNTPMLHGGKDPLLLRLSNVLRVL